ncbi:MAG: RluA family pseudouridine synthase [Proteobacteria bacterium]|nr:RluA family pseudouridine synthase [Pseudomonadota bacterium]
MTSVQTLTVAVDDVDIRLDKWFKRHFPTLGHGPLEKMIRTGQVRVDGRKAKAGQRLEQGQSIRVPPIDEAATVHSRVRAEPPARRRGDEELAEQLSGLILHMDDEVLAIDKPPGLPVQGGTGSPRHVDGALDGLCFEMPKRPKLVHRLDKDTSGVLLLARTVQAARWLTEAFRHRSARKTYWAAVVGQPRFSKGTIDLPIAKLPGRAGEKMAVDREQGQRATTDYAVVEQLGSRTAWVALRPRTGRTHQIRVHMAALGQPVLGDGKYGGELAFLEAVGLSRKLHLHARSIAIKRPNGSWLEVEAPLPEHMVRTWDFLGFDMENAANPFLDEEEDS